MSLINRGATVEDSFVKFALAAVGMVASGTVAGLIKVWFDLYNFKLQMATKRPTHDEYLELREDVREIKGMVSKIVARLHIPTAHE